MTKAMMIETVQKKASDLWTALKKEQMLAMHKYPQHGGYEAEKQMLDEQAVRYALNHWCAIHKLCEELCIGYETSDEAFEYQNLVYRYFYK